MKNLGKISILLLIFIFTHSFGQEAKEIKWGKIKGKIFDEYRNLLTGAHVSIQGTYYEGETDDEGVYYIIGVKPGYYNIEAKLPNHHQSKMDSIEVIKAKTTECDFILTEFTQSDRDSIKKEIKLIPDKVVKDKDSGNQKPRTIEMGDIEKLEVTPVAKPIIYLYPEKETEVNVKLNYKGTFTSTYPKYPEKGWTVTAKPDGTLKDKSGKEYYSLFWEGVAERTFTLDEGFIVKNEDAAAFLEKSLKTLGLNFKEANEFIIYWLPELEKHPYNLIHFSTKEYEELAKLNVTPAPDTVIRVFMVFKGLDKPIEVKPQTLVPKVRKGFTVVEWGGSEMKNEAKSVIR